MPRRSEAEELLEAALLAEPLDGWDLTAQHQFHSERKWALDFAFPSQRLGVEVNGRGRHQTVKGSRDDYEKWNTALLMGWRILHFPATDKRKAAEWAAFIREVLVTPPS